MPFKLPYTLRKMVQKLSLGQGFSNISFGAIYVGLLLTQGTWVPPQ